MPEGDARTKNEWIRLDPLFPELHSLYLRRPLSDCTQLLDILGADFAGERILQIIADGRKVALQSVEGSRDYDSGSKLAAFGELCGWHDEESFTQRLKASDTTEETFRLLTAKASPNTVKMRQLYASAWLNGCTPRHMYRRLPEISWAFKQACLDSCQNQPAAPVRQRNRRPWFLALVILFAGVSSGLLGIVSVVPDGDRIYNEKVEACRQAGKELKRPIKLFSIELVKMSELC